MFLIFLLKSPFVPPSRQLLGHYLYIYIVQVVDRRLSGDRGREKERASESTERQRETQ